ncbi:MAG: radical SAM family heme chaperone HemW [Rhodothalassiaceae bacterium]
MDEARWRAALLLDLARMAKRTRGMTLCAIFFGGGTPSLMSGATVGALIDAATGHWPVADALEITLEANPSSAEAGRFRDYRAAGVTRLSIGIQALRDDALRFLGRLHGREDALAALRLARETFPRHSFDLIYARPGQTCADWRAELDEALALSGGHLSLYQLSIEADTAFHRRHRRGEFCLPDEELAADLYELTDAMTQEAGLPAYEISNHARPGEECRHNLIYWQGGHYVGIGPGAHGRLPDGTGGAVATEQEKHPERWLAALARGEGVKEEKIAPLMRAEEALMMGLRLSAGISRETFLRLTGQRLEAVVDAAVSADLVARGLLIDDGAHLRASPNGRLLLNALTGALLA